LTSATSGSTYCKEGTGGNRGGGGEEMEEGQPKKVRKELIYYMYVYIYIYIYTYKYVCSFGLYRLIEI
jgi:hypothetical protein